MSCRDCFQGHVHHGELTGTTTKLHGLDIYIAEPPAGTDVKGIVVIVPDAFGWEMPNNRLLADSPAVLSVIYNTGPFFIKNRFGVLTPKVQTFMQTLRKNQAASLPLGAAGFCWGGKVVFQLCADMPETRVDGHPLLDAAFAGHPSALQIPADGVAVKIPLSVASGDKDTFLSEAQALELKTELESRPEPVGPDGKAKGELRLYPGCGHGFCVRGDVNVLDIKDAAERAEEQALTWFNKHLVR